MIARWIIWAAMLAMSYYAVSEMALALRHPELTQTQLLLRSADAVRWH